MIVYNETCIIVRLVPQRGKLWCPGLHAAASKGHVSTVALLLMLCRLYDSADNAGTTPLHLAVHGERCWGRGKKEREKEINRNKNRESERKQKGEKER